MSISTSDVQMAATLRPHIYYQSSSGNEITPNPALVIRQHIINNREGSSQQVSLEKRLHQLQNLPHLRSLHRSSVNPKPHKYASQEVNETAFKVCF